MIQNLENKMEINQLESWIKKMQEMFNKDLQELKNRQSAMNTITEIKYILQRTNSRLSEAEEWINELEVRMVEMTEAEQQKK